MSRFAIPCVLFVLVTACSTAPAVSTASRHIRSGDQARIQGLYVPAGTRLSVRLDQAIGTTLSTRGERFTAVVSQPLSDSSGVVVVRWGARVVGRVASLAGTTGPRMRLDLEQIDTIAGPAPMRASVEASGAKVYAGQREYSMVPVGQDSLVGSRHAVTSQRARVFAGQRIGGGPSGEFYRVYRPREVILPAGATLDLLLTRPLLVPGTQLLRR